MGPSRPTNLTYPQTMESIDARREDWLHRLDAQVLTMEEILKSKGRNAECTYEIRAIDPRGFEQHKHTLAEFESVDTDDRVAVDRCQHVAGVRRAED